MSTRCLSLRVALHPAVHKDSRIRPVVHPHPAIQDHVMISNGNAPRTSSKEEIKEVELPKSRTVHTDDVDLDNLTVHYTLYPNKWARWRWMVREPAAEFLGTMVLILFGDGVVCQVSTTSRSTGRLYNEEVP
jgi:hypothetical protein